MSENTKIEFRDKRRIKTIDDVCDDAAKADLDRVPTFVERLQEKISSNDEKLKDYIAAHKEKMVEMDQVRSRIEGNAGKIARDHFCDLIEGLLPVIDDFDRALELASKSHDGDPMLEGVHLLRDGLFKVLVSKGLEVIDCLDQPFDPEVAQALGSEPVDDDEKDNVVVAQMSVGYRYEGRVIRPALVRVGQKVVGRT